MKVIDRKDATPIVFKLNKILIMTNFISLVYGVLATVGIILIFEADVKQPYILTVDSKAEQVVHVEPIYKEGDGMDLYKESIVRGYVKKRETIDLQTDGKRWVNLKELHTDEIESDFAALMRKENRDSPLHQFYQARTVRRIRILSSNNLAPDAPNTYQVEWVAEDISVDEKDRGTIRNTQTFMSKLTVELQERDLTIDNRLINPFGVTITDYSVTKKATMGEVR